MTLGVIEALFVSNIVRLIFNVTLSSGCMVLCLIDPINLFNSLDKSKSSIKNLRTAQHEVLTKYSSELLEKQRVGIKLPTGSGKSLIAILILESWRRSGKVVGILTANKGLAEDIKRRCDEIGIPSATIFGSQGTSKYRIARTRNLRNYKLKKIIGIFNYHSFLYGTEYRQEIYPPDILVIDDASDFETVRNNFFTIRIQRTEHEKVYNDAIDVLLPHSHIYPNIQDFASRTGRQTDVELVFFTHASSVWSVVRKHLPELMKDPNFKYSYNRNRDYRSTLLIFVSEDEIEFRPLLIPEKSLKMGSIEQIIFTSATLPEEELLHKIFGIREQILIIDENSLSKKARDQIATMGKRLIFPLYGADLKDGAGKETILNLVKLHNKLLVLANSNYEAYTIRKYLESKDVPTLIYKNSEDCNHFAYNMRSGVLVCANRYFGLDFPGETCQVAVIARLPAIWDNVDAFQFAVLGNSFYMEQRIGNRLTQSLGRCNRLVKDEALYYVLDSRLLSRLTGEEQYLRYLPRNMYAEFVTGYYLSEGGLIAPAIEYGRSSFFGKRDPEYEKYLQEEIENWDLQKINMPVSKYDLEIEAWEKSLTSGYEAAGQLFDFVGNYFKDNISDTTENLTSLAAFNFYLSAMNFHNAYEQYKNPIDKKHCQDELKEAIKTGGNRSWFNRLRAIFNSLVEDATKKLPLDMIRLDSRRIKEQIVLEYDDFINRNTSKNRNWKDVFDQNTKYIAQGTHGQMLMGLQQVFELIGYRVRRGDNAKGEPDLLVRSPSFVQKHQLSVEAKTREKGEETLTDDVRETLGDAGVIERKASDYQTYPVLITQKEEIVPKALEIAKQKVRIFRTSLFLILINEIRKRIERWESCSSSERTSLIDNAISPYELDGLLRQSEQPLVHDDELRKVLS